MAVADVARDLGVTDRRVRSLIKAGALPAEKVGGVYVLSERDVDAFARRYRPKHVRAMSPRIAWAAAALGDGVRPTWLRADELSRLRARLSSEAAPTGAWRAQLAAAGARARFRAGPAQVDALLDSPHTVRTGASATNVVGDRLTGAPGADVWVANADVAIELTRGLGLLRSSAGNVTISVPGADVDRISADGRNAFRLIVARDLMLEDDPRARAAGEDLILHVEQEASWRVSRRPAQ
ncbi:helix-turn-helix domain-containing protein [Isoptericola sp. NPDC056605]|uniref:helix-turn-helix domain-containing protein n=1 Tax=Isoptericola sp. NPDC056605 TaxID=3345876 RepID=UPI003683E04B